MLGGSGERPMLGRSQIIDEHPAHRHNRKHDCSNGQVLDAPTHCDRSREKVNQSKTGKHDICREHFDVKPDTDDIREAPSLYILDKLIQKGYEIKAYDPVASENIKKILGEKIKFVKNLYQAVEKTDAMVILTEWNEFKQIDLSKVKKLMTHPFIFDGRNIYKPEIMKKFGFKYFSIGRPS